MKLSLLVEKMKPVKTIGDIDIDFSGINHDSRLVQPGDLFVAIPGLKTDGGLYIREAVKRGAVAVIGEKEPGIDVAFVQVQNARRALGEAAACLYGNPCEKLEMVGITGTNGKTTTGFLIKTILEKAGRRTGLIGSITNYLGDAQVAARHTTPDALELHRLLAKMVKNQVETVVMEVSSHALALDRVAECEFQTAVFTNLTHDHLDFHKDFQQYQEAKARLFREFMSVGGTKIINQDSDFGRVLINKADVNERVISYGLSKQADIWADRIGMRFDGTPFYLVTDKIRQHIELPLVGLFNVYNALAAISYGLSVGIDLELIIEAVEEFAGVPGRLQMVNAGQEFKVIIDYAHTPDSLEQVLKTVKALSSGRVITVFGCTGDRDTSKRPIMGEIASRWSDYFYITSDDPHDEDPMSIIKEIEKGAIERGKLRRYDYMLEVDRYQAIEQALKKASKSDVVFIAGKGHESVQIFKDKTVEYSDEKAVRNILSNIAKK